MAMSPVWGNVGVAETFAVPDPVHYGVYGYVAATVPIEARPIYVIPGVGLELCPEFERGGVLVSTTAERTLSPRLAADAIVSLVHDQPGLSWSESTFALGVGGGVSITLGSVVVSPSLTLFRTLDGPGWSLAPTLNLAHQLW